MSKRRPPADPPRTDWVPGQLTLDGKPGLPPSMLRATTFDASPDEPIHPGPRGAETMTRVPVADPRTPKPCPVCGQWCVHDGWDHVHGNGLGIGSCTDPARTLLAKLLSREHAHVELDGEAAELFVHHSAVLNDAERALCRELGVHEIRVQP